MPNRPLDLDNFGDDDLASPATPSGVVPGGIAARAMGQAAAGAEPPYLKGLNPEQRDAVLSTDGPLLVLAGAGTGKTRVLTTRLAHILATMRVKPHQLLAVTFTNKAAREMRERIGLLIGNSVEGLPWLGTFHSLGLKFVQYHAELLGLRPRFSVLDDDDQVRLLKQILKAGNIDDGRWPARQLASLIDSWKNRALTPDRVPASEAHGFANGKGAEIYAEYQQRLKTVNAVDFGDLLLEPLRLFKEQPEILTMYQQRFKYMLVDEYQDTNIAQYLWLRLLAGGHHNICCVGDDDQSIYGWRGAEVDNILRFEKDFPGAKVVRLEQNYRSTPDILGAASGLIAKNEARLGKTLRTSRDESEPLIVRGHWDGDEEARAIGDDIESLQRKGERLNDMAILVRASFQMRAFEDRFMTLGIPYRVIGGPRFFERAEIRDALAYLKVVASPDNDLAFERIINTPKRGIGDTSVKKLYDVARSRASSLFQSAMQLATTDEFSAKARTALRKLLDDIKRWREIYGFPQYGYAEVELAKTLDEFGVESSELVTDESENSFEPKTKLITHTELAEIVLDESGYTEMWQNDKSPEAQGRLENLKELVRSMGEFENLTGFLEHVSLVMDRDAGDAEDRVNIMTLHSAKGLEFGTVFLPGWEEGLFPHQRSLDEKGRAGLEEERRLAYVGITRAKRRATISFAQNRRVHALWQSAIPSRFIDELPPNHVEVVAMTTSYGGHGIGGYGQSRFDTANTFRSGNTYATPGWQRAQNNYAKGTGLKSSPKFIEGESVVTGEVSYETGDRVFHQKFGYGTVTFVEGNKLTVDFEKAGEKRVIDSFVERG